jgi:hypothetical protein
MTALKLRQYAFIALVFLLQHIVGGFRTSHPFRLNKNDISTSIVGSKRQFPTDSSLAGQNEQLVRLMMSSDGEFMSFEDMEADRKLEDEMARELYDELRAGKPGLPIEDFLQWEDIVDIMSTGIIDDETMEVIIEEVGVSKDGILSFEKFRELVDLVNQVAIAFEQEADMMNEFDIDAEDEDVDGIDGGGGSSSGGGEDPYKWMVEAMMNNVKKKQE